MAKRRTGLMCPECGSADTPRLIVRGPGSNEDVAEGVVLRCRACQHEWSEDPRRRAS